MTSTDYSAKTALKFLAVNASYCFPSIYLEELIYADLYLEAMEQTRELSDVIVEARLRELLVST